MVSASSGHTWSLYLYMHRPILCKAMFLSDLIFFVILKIIFPIIREVRLWRKERYGPLAIDHSIND